MKDGPTRNAFKNAALKCVQARRMGTPAPLMSAECEREPEIVSIGGPNPDVFVGICVFRLVELGSSYS